MIRRPPGSDLDGPDLVDPHGVETIHARWGLPSTGWPTAPRAVALVPLGADEADWHAARAPRVGASQLAAVLGKSPYQSPFSLWCAKRYGLHIEQTDAMRIGTLLEDTISALFQERRPDLEVCRPGAALYGGPPNTDMGHLCCTPDRIAVHPDPVDGHLVFEPVELKSDEGGAGWGKDGTPDVPEHHRIQVMAQCAILGARRGWLARLAGKRLTVHPVDFDGDAPKLFELWRMRAVLFLADVAEDRRPDIDGHRATTAALLNLYPDIDEARTAVIDDGLAAAYLAAGHRAAEAKREAERLTNLVREAMAGAKYATLPDGTTVATRVRYKRAAYTVEACEIDQLRRKQ